MVSKVKEKVLSGTDKFFTFLEGVEKNGNAAFKQNGYTAARVFGFISAGILLFGIIGGIIFAAAYRYNANGLRRAISLLDFGSLEMSRYVNPLILSIENTVESLVKWTVIYGIAFTFMLFLQITLFLMMLSVLRNTSGLNVNKTAGTVK
jgi:hypothetical protein